MIPHHTKRPFPGNHNIIQCKIYSRQFSLMINTARKHHPPLNLILVTHQMIQRRIHGFLIQLRQISKRSKIHT